MKPSEILTKARDIIADPRYWVRNTGAEDRMGMTVECTDSSACRFCYEGAVAKVIGVPDWEEVENNYPEVYGYMSGAALQVGGKDSPFQVNDDDGYEATLEMANLAIELALKDRS